jgi:hypothetical protein
MKFYVKNNEFQIYSNLFVFLMIYFMISAGNLSNRNKQKNSSCRKKFKYKWHTFFWSLSKNNLKKIQNYFRTIRHHGFEKEWPNLQKSKLIFSILLIANIKEKSFQKSSFKNCFTKTVNGADPLKLNSKIKKTRKMNNHKPRAIWSINIYRNITVNKNVNFL